MFEIEALISSSLPFWETVADVSVIVAGLAAVAVIAIDIPGLYISDSGKAKIKWALASLLIAGVTGQITATKRLTAITGEIVAYLNDRAQTANKLAGEANKLAGDANERAALANERARLLELAIETQKEKNLEFAAKNIDLEDKNTELTKGLRGVDLRTGDRTINNTERANLARGLRGKKYAITVVMVDDREARQYATAIVSALRNAHAQVRIEDIRSSPETGVIVCEKLQRDANLARILRSGAIEAKLTGKGKRPEFCERVVTPSASNGLVGLVFDAFFGGPNATASAGRGAIVFVGQKIPRP